MGFKVGNKLACVQKGEPKARTQQWDNIVGWLLGEGGIAYSALIAQLSRGEELLKPQHEFMDRYEGLIEYHQPKLARAELTGKNGKDLIPTPIMDVIRKDNSNR